MKKIGYTLACAALIAAPTLAADPATIDWSKVAATKVTLFYPGQSSYQWLLSGHKGAKAIRGGKACVSCHEGEEKDMGEALVKGGPLEPMPVKGKDGFKELSVQAAYDANNAYLRFQWKTLNAFGGIEHPFYRFDGKEWKGYGNPKLDQVVQDGTQPGIYEDRMSVMIDDGKVPNFAKQGCWLTCHDGERDMPKLATKEQVAGNALFKEIKKRDVRKYLPATRAADNAEWQSGKSKAEIDQIKAAGGFLDLIQWRAHRSNPVGMTDDGYVLEYRNADAGVNPFSSNSDKVTHAPKYMYDASKVGYKSITADQLRKGEHFLTLEKNAVAFDPNAGWKEGDMLPKYYTTRTGSKGSAADNGGMGTWKDGMWTVVMTRPLGLTNADDKNLKEGGVYNVGFAVHDDNITTRGHQVSFVRTLGFGAKADIQAVKLP
ncbi:MAG: hypothetical protein K0B16_00520 [Burkholderiaceae bacterium]|nr:hypothetical protein [Burkholderiaceae bacterium]